MVIQTAWNWAHQLARTGLERELGIADNCELGAADGCESRTVLGA
jgi:hypothetical protein